MLEVEVGGLTHEVMGEATACHMCLCAIVRDGVAQLTHTSDRTGAIAAADISWVATLGRSL